MTRTTSLPPGARYLPDGRIKLTVDVPPGPDGKRRQRSRIITTVDEAKSFYASVRASVDQDTYIRPDGISVARHLDEWLRSKRPTIRATTYRGYVDALKPVRRLLGTRKLQTLRKADIELVLTGMAARGRSGRTTNLTLTVLRAALQSAVDEQMLPRNVAALVPKRKETQRQLTTWTVEELEQFRASIVDHPYRVGFELSCLGLRRGEVVGLQWGDVDSDAGQLIIRNTIVLATSKAEASTPKSERSNRRLPMGLLPGLVELFRSARISAGLRVRTPGATVLADADGNPLRPEFYGDQLTRAMKAAGVPVIRVHDIRHTSVTVMLEAGVPLHVVAQWHGHDPAMMLRVYAHATPNSLGLAAAAMVRVGAWS